MDNIIISEAERLASAILALMVGEGRCTTEAHGSGSVTTYLAARTADSVIVREEYTAAASRISALQAEDEKSSLECRPEELAAELERRPRLASAAGRALEGRRVTRWESEIDSRKSLRMKLAEAESRARQ